MVASSRMCRRFVRRRDKVTLAMQDLRSPDGFWLRPLTRGRQLRQTGAGRKTHLAAKKRRQARESVHIRIHFEHPRLLASPSVRSCPSIAKDVPLPAESRETDACSTAALRSPPPPRRV